MWLNRQLLKHYRDYRNVIAAQNYARRKGLGGIEFARFSQKLGWKLIRKRDKTGIPLVNFPLVDPRLFEFSFALRHLPENGRQFLDISSPFLFSLYVSHHIEQSHIRMSNPDQADASHCEDLARRLEINNISIEPKTIADIEAADNSFDCIWSISVVEHISGESNDTAAVSRMKDLLAPGGTLLLTFPAAKSYTEDYRDSDPYGTQEFVEEKGYFYQRWYDQSAIESRITNAFGCAPIAKEFFGEKVPGAFDVIEKKRLASGPEWLSNAARRMADEMEIFEDIDQMPGVGICGIAFRKALHD